MIRMLCPSCHMSLSCAELEFATIQGQECLVCPECSTVLLVETVASKDANLLLDSSAHA